MEAMMRQLGVLTRKVDRLQSSFDVVQSNCGWCGGPPNFYPPPSNPYPYYPPPPQYPQYPPQQQYPPPPYFPPPQFDPHFEPQNVEPQYTSNDSQAQDNSYLEDVFRRFVQAYEERQSQLEITLEERGVVLKNLENTLGAIKNALIEEGKNNEVNLGVFDDDVVKEATETLMDEVQLECSQSTAQVPPPVKEYVPTAPLPPTRLEKSPLPFPSFTWMDSSKEIEEDVPSMVEPMDLGEVDFEELFPLPPPPFHYNYPPPDGTHSHYSPHFIQGAGSRIPSSCN